jgi:hypothetical protein
MVLASKRQDDDDDDDDDVLELISHSLDSENEVSFLFHCTVYYFNQSFETRSHM